MLRLTDYPSRHSSRGSGCRTPVQTLCMVHFLRVLEPRLPVFIKAVLGFSILLLGIFLDFEFLKKNERSGKKKCLYGVRKTDLRVFRYRAWSDTESTHGLQRPSPCHPSGTGGYPDGHRQGVRIKTR